MDTSRKFRSLLVAFFAVALVALGGWMASAIGAERPENSQKTTVTTRTVTTQHSVSRDDERDALTLRREVERRIAIFQEQLAAVDKNAYYVAPVSNAARTSWTNRSSRATVNGDTSMTVYGGPVVITPEHGNPWIWESPAIRGPQPSVTYENGWTVITPRR